MNRLALFNGTTPGSILSFALPLILLIAVALGGATLARAATGDGPSDSALVCAPLHDPIAYATANTPRAVAAGDFNEDGIIDLAVACNNTVSILLGLGAGGIGNGTYSAPVNMPIAGSLLYIATSDFNDDGITDLAVCHLGGVSVFLGHGTAGIGNGTFGSAATFAAGANPQRIAPADFNEDGIVDVVVTNSSSNNVSILLGQGANGVGDGTFSPAVNYATGTAPGGVAIGDFNEDGIPDIVVINNAFSSSSVSVLIGQGAAGRGDGTFAAAANYPTGGSNPAGITTGDFNEDGRTDLAVVNINSAMISILLGNGAGGVGNGTFAAATAVPSSVGGRDIATADFNGDGRADLAVSNLTNDKVQLFVGGGAGTVGDGTFALASSDSVGQDPRTIALGDFNEDGAPDVATAKSAGTAAAVLLGGCAMALDAGILAFDNSGQVWPVATEQYIGWTRGAAVMAVNIELSRDGGENWEMIATNVTESSFKWTATMPATAAARVRISDAALPTRFDVSDVDFTICAPFSAGTAIQVGAGPSAAAVGDFNDDGIPDLAVVCQSLGAVQVMMGHGASGVGNGTYGPPIGYGFDGESTDIVAADFNEDGITDLAFTNPMENTLEILVGEGVNGHGNGVFHIDPVCPPIAEGASALLTGDFNEDGITDLVVACRISDIIAILIGIGGAGTGSGSFAPALNFAVGLAPSSMVSGDFDENGFIDLVAISDGTSNVVMLRGGASSIPTEMFSVESMDLPVAQLGRAIVTGEFTGDGVADLAVTSPVMSTVSILPGLGAGGVGTGSFGMPMPFAVSTTPLALQKGDFNIDGITDLAIAGPGGGPGGQLEVLYGGGSEANGNGTFSSRVKLPIGTGAAGILAGDFLEDNTIDLLALCSGETTIAPLLGGCQDPGVASINVTSPNGGEVTLVGSAQTVSWTTSPQIDAVDVDVSRDGGVHWETVLHNTNESSVSWTVTPPLSQNARVRVSENGLPNRADLSDAPFAIATPAGVGEPVSKPGGSGAAPLENLLSAAYPSPSARETRFACTLPRTGRATFEVYDSAGRLVRSLADRTLVAGDRAVTWDGCGADGTRQSDGVYFLRAQWPGFEAVRKIVRVGAAR
jgi:hypothetical protein